MSTETTVWCTTKFEGMHYWLDAPQEVAFLRTPHRHLFGVRVEIYINHYASRGDNREVEFILLKRKVDDYLSELCTSSHSCERIATDLGNHLKRAYKLEVASVSVDEDGENGSTVRWLR